MADYPALTIWTDAYLADTSDLDIAAHGFYMLMIFVAWRRPDCALPPDLDEIKRLLAGHARFHGHTFNAIVPNLLARFWTQGDDGKWRQKRLLRERERRTELSTAASKSAQKRWSNRVQNEIKQFQSDLDLVPKPPEEPSNTNAPDDATAMRPQCEPICSQPYQVSKKKESSFNGGGKAEHRQSPTPTTALSDDEKLHRFASWLAPKVAGGWQTVSAAYEPANPNHRTALAACQTAARNNGKGWPLQWPK